MSKDYMKKTDAVNAKLHAAMQKRSGIVVKDAKTFGDYLVYVYMSKDPDAIKFRNNTHSFILPKNWAAIWSKGVFPLVRGMHDMPADIDSLMSISSDEDWSWSLNPAYAVPNFCHFPSETAIKKFPKRFGRLGVSTDQEGAEGPVRQGLV